jgi:hypothetical protein
MSQWKSHPVILFLGVVSWLAVCANAQERHKFGETVALGSNASLVVVKRDVSEFRPELGWTGQNLVAFELRFGESDEIYIFRTDRGDPSHSDIVAQCGTERVNALKMGIESSVAPPMCAALSSGSAPSCRTVTFGLPGAYQAKDGLWVSMDGGLGMASNIIVFDLPAECAPGQARLLVTVGVGLGDKEKKHQLVFTEDSSKP